MTPSRLTHECDFAVFQTLANYCLLLILAFGLILPSVPVHAQAFPSKPVRLIVPVPAGSGLDTISRQFGQRLALVWGQPVVVENRVGANFILGTEHVARSAPDGYTLLVAPDAALTVNPHLYAKLPYDPVKDLAPVTQLVTFTQMLVAAVSMPANSIAELVTYSKANPGRISYASFGVGSQPHLLGEMVKFRTGADLTHVPYKGIPQALTAVIAGETQLTWSSPFSIVGHIRSGKLKALALAAAQRTPLLPEVPTFAELGMPDIEYTQWFGLFAPATTPRPLIDRIHADFSRLLTDPEVRDRELVGKGYEPSGLAPDLFAALIRREIGLRGQVVKRIGARAE